MTGWTASGVLDRLRAAFETGAPEGWVLLTEVPLVGRGWNNRRTIDVMVLQTYESAVGFRRVGIEVKVSRADYRNESDAKRLPTEEAVHDTYYAAPAGLIDPASLPDGWGLIEVYDGPVSYLTGSGVPLGPPAALTRLAAGAELRVPRCDLDYLVMVGVRRAARAEDRIRCAADDVAEVAALREQVDRLTGQLARRDLAVARERAAAKRSRSLLMATTRDGRSTCSDCGHPVRYRTGGDVWVHDDDGHETACHRARAEADRQAREAKVGARYLRGWPGPVEPVEFRDPPD